MHLILAICALGAALIGLVYSTTEARAAARLVSRANARLFWSLFTWGALLGLVLFVATLPTRPPFAPGLTLGWGFLIGLLAGLYATVEARRSHQGGRWLVRVAGLVSAAVVGPTLVLIIFGSDSANALIGCALGAVLVAAIWRSGFAPMEYRDDSDEEVAAFRGVELFALVTAALVAGMWLALERYQPASGSIAGAYWALPALLAALTALMAILAAGLATSGPSPERYHRPLALALAVGILLIVAVWLLDVKILGDGLPGVVVVVGVFGFALIAWVAIVMPCESADELASAEIGAALIISLVALAVMAVSFKVLHGFGESLALVGGIPVLAFLVVGERRESRTLLPALVTGGFAVVLLLAMYRVFLEKNGPGAALDFQQHYNYFGLILGAVAGFALLSYVGRSCQVVREEFDPFTALGALVQRTTVLGLVVVASPLLVVVVWGIKTLSGFLVGLVVAEVLWLLLIGFVAGQRRQVALTAAPHLYLLSAFLVAIQFAHLVVPLAGGPRLYRGIVLAVAVVIAVLCAVASLRRSPRVSEGGEGSE